MTSEFANFIGRQVILLVFEREVEDPGNLVDGSLGRIDGVLTMTRQVGGATEFYFKGSNNGYYIDHEKMYFELWDPSELDKIGRRQNNGGEPTIIHSSK